MIFCYLALYCFLLSLIMHADATTTTVAQRIGRTLRSPFRNFFSPKPPTMQPVKKPVASKGKKHKAKDIPEEEYELTQAEKDARALTAVRLGVPKQEEENDPWNLAHRRRFSPSPFQRPKLPTFPTIKPKRIWPFFDNPEESEDEDLSDSSSDEDYGDYEVMLEFEGSDEDLEPVIKKPINTGESEDDDMPPLEDDPDREADVGTQPTVREQNPPSAETSLGNVKEEGAALKADSSEALPKNASPIVFVETEKPIEEITVTKPNANIVKVQSVQLSFLIPVEGSPKRTEVVQGEKSTVITEQTGEQHENQKGSTKDLNDLAADKPSNSRAVLVEDLETVPLKVPESDPPIVLNSSLVTIIPPILPPSSPSLAKENGGSVNFHPYRKKPLFKPTSPLPVNQDPSVGSLIKFASTKGSNSSPSNSSPKDIRSPNISSKSPRSPPTKENGQKKLTKSPFKNGYSPTTRSRFPLKKGKKKPTLEQLIEDRITIEAKLKQHRNGCVACKKAGYDKNAQETHRYAAPTCSSMIAAMNARLRRLDIKIAKENLLQSQPRKSPADKGPEKSGPFGVQPTGAPSSRFSPTSPNKSKSDLSNTSKTPNKRISK